MKELEIYIHVPFCVKKCAYCDFFSGAFGKSEQQAYFDLLQKEIEECDTTYKTEYEVTSIFIGGGTPSSVDAKYILRVLQKVKEEFNVSLSCEISMESNPGTLTEEKLRIYKEAGINRLSIGLQSTEDDLLKTLGRIHDYETFLSSFHLARKLGFTNINIDLMSGIPGLTLDKWKDTLEKIISLNPEHISSYSLIIEEGTLFYEKYQNKEDEFPSEEEDREMVHLTNSLLEKAGYIHYEVSNYAKEGFFCQHNLGYWDKKDYLGFGAAASSTVGNKRWTHKDSLTYLYEENKEEEILSEKDQMEEFMFLGLRKVDGISQNIFLQRFHRNIYDIYGKVLLKYRELGFIQEEEDKIFLSEEAFDVMNSILVDFLFD